MQENYTHYISNSIKNLYRRRLIAPLLYLLFTVILWLSPQVVSSMFPADLSALQDTERMYVQGNRYVSAALEDLKFTGYTRERFHRTIGYFYYTVSMDETTCYIVLLSPSTCRQGAPELKKAAIYGKILPADDSYETLLEHLADDLSWTDFGIRSKVNPCYLSEPDFGYRPGIFLLLVLAASGAFAIASLLFDLFFLFRPHLAPPCRALKQFGNPKELLAFAEEELAALPQPAAEDRLITEHFFIELSKYHISIVPIRETFIGFPEENRQEARTLPPKI